MLEGHVLLSDDGEIVNFEVRRSWGENVFGILPRSHPIAVALGPANASYRGCFAVPWLHIKVAKLVLDTTFRGRFHVLCQYCTGLSRFRTFFEALDFFQAFKSQCYTDSIRRD